MRPEAVDVSSVPIPRLRPGDPDRTSFGALRYRSGLVLTSPHSSFGGLSGLALDSTGRGLVAITDTAVWFTAELRRQDGRLSSLAKTRLAPMLGHEGQPLTAGPDYDTEGLAMADGAAFVSFERRHGIRRFDWAHDGVGARGQSLPVPPEILGLPANGGIEALAVIPSGHPLSGRLVAIAEGPWWPDQPTPAWLLGDSPPLAFEVARRNGFHVTDAAFLPGGDLLLLERRFLPWSGFGCRIRRLPASALHAGAVADGATVLEAGWGDEIDNMEGLAIHRDPATGDIIVTLVSDDNFSPLQRTLLLDFVLVA